MAIGCALGGVGLIVEPAFADAPAEDPACLADALDALATVTNCADLKAVQDTYWGCMSLDEQVEFQQQVARLEDILPC